jgi:hypothetical protein
MPDGICRDGIFVRRRLSILFLCANSQRNIGHSRIAFGFVARAFREFELASCALFPQTKFATASTPLARADQSLGRQRGVRSGFDQSDRAVSIHVFPEVRGRNRLASLLFGQTDIGGIYRAISVHITDQHAHGNGNVAAVSTIVRVIERNSDSLSCGSPQSRYGVALSAELFGKRKRSRWRGRPFGCAQGRLCQLAACAPQP